MMYSQQKIRGFCHVYIGQEAIAAGLVSAIRKEDALVTAYRQHGIALSRGISSRACMAELYGKETGCVKGKGGSMHFFPKSTVFLEVMELLAPRFLLEQALHLQNNTAIAD